MLFSKLLSRGSKTLAAALIAFGLASGSASATTFNAGTLTTTPYTNAAMVSPGTFTDIYTFAIGALPTAVASTVSLDLGVPGTPFNFLHITGLTLSLYDSSNFFLGSAPLNLTATLSPGNYEMRVSGLADGTSGGGYGFAIAAIPEPGQWLMLLAGIAMLGVMVRRRAG